MHHIRQTLIGSLACVFLLTLGTPAHASTNYISPGLNNSGNTLWDRATGWTAFRVSPSSSAQISSASALFDSNAATGYRVQVFSDSAGTIGPVIGTLSQTSSGSSTVQFSGSVSLCSGSSYWIAVIGTVASPNYLADEYVFDRGTTALWSWDTGTNQAAWTSNSGTTYNYYTPTTEYSGLALSGNPLVGTCGSSAESASSTSSPAPLMQQFGRPASGTCTEAASSELNWSQVAGGGWGESWSEWMNGGVGGFVCTRALVFSTDLGKWVVG